MDIDEVDLANKFLFSTVQTTILLTLTPPMNPFTKINADGFLPRDLGLAGIGGLIRDANGFWVRGFMQCIGHASALHAEICAVYMGMQVAWCQRFGKNILGCDSQDAIKLIWEPIASHFSYNLIRKVLAVIDRVGLMAAMKTQTIQTKEMVQQLFKKPSQDMTMGVYLYKTWDPGGIEYSIGFTPLDGYCQPVGNEKRTKTMKTTLEDYRPYQLLIGFEAIGVGNELRRFMAW
ncbi:hypothetical protein Vadar_034277 [Vaccinium darrowii]|uniref:Uncharacterized protein n=1 Tax=Vaccinium darrowii TaxID=229202 RepID=A0ACB7XVV0_9ERIC|nr:hypothetical protein Vadar_034277 [Vaccinium darrowii]